MNKYPTNQVKIKLGLNLPPFTNPGADNTILSPFKQCQTTEPFIGMKEVGNPAVNLTI